MLFRSPCILCGKTLSLLRDEVSLKARRGSVPLCPTPSCPLLRGMFPLQVNFPRGGTLSGPSPPSIFVGSHGYPRVRVGPLISLRPSLDLPPDPSFWVFLDPSTILEHRSSLLCPFQVTSVTRPFEGPLPEALRGLALSERPLETEVVLDSPLRIPLVPRVDSLLDPTGPAVSVRSVRLVENPVVPRPVEALLEDFDAPAEVALWELHERGVSAEHASRLLSAGLLGERRRRRLVPTRWSITATDDLWGRRIREELYSFPPLSNVELYVGGLLGNRFYVLLVPHEWSFEMIECVRVGGVPRVLCEREGPYGRSSYPRKIAGAYFAARLSILEHLRRRRRKGAAFLLRVIGEDYLPLGVWVVREGVRLTLNSRPVEVAGVLEGLSTIESLAPFPGWRREAIGARSWGSERTLWDFGLSLGAPRGSKMEVPRG